MNRYRRVKQMLHYCRQDGSLFCPAAGKWSLIPPSPSLGPSLPSLSFSIKCPSPLCPCRTRNGGRERGRDRGKENERVPLSKSMSEREGRSDQATKLRAPHYFRPAELRRPSAAGRTPDPTNETNLCSRDNFVCVVSRT